MTNLLAWMIDFVIGGLFDGVAELVTVDMMTGSSASTASSIYNIVQPVGVVLIYIFFVIGLIDAASHEHFTFDGFIRQFVLLIFSIYVIDHGWEIMCSLSDVAVKAASAIYNNYESGNLSNLTGETLIENFRSALGLTGILSVLSDLILLVILLIPFIISFIIHICVSVVFYSRQVEIYVFACFAPIALSDVYKNGLQSNGLHYFKEFFAIALQGAVLMAIVVFSTNVIFDLALNAAADISIWNISAFWQFIIKYIIVYAAACTLVMKSLQLSRRIVGA